MLERGRIMLITGKVTHFEMSGFVALLAVGLLLSGCYIIDNPPRTLQMAAFKGNKKAVNRFLSEGVSVNARGEQGERALHYAVYGKQESMVKLLLAKGADVDVKNDNGRTPLHAAAWKGYVDIAGTLIAKGTNINAKDNKGMTALDCAEEQGHGGMMELLRNHGAIRGTQKDKNP